MTVSLEGHPDKLDDFEELLDSYAIVEMQRTGQWLFPNLIGRHDFVPLTPTRKER